VRRTAAAPAPARSIPAAALSQLAVLLACLRPHMLPLLLLLLLLLVLRLASAAL
jgi:hypothetical protein